MSVAAPVALGAVRGCAIARSITLFAGAYYADKTDDFPQIDTEVDLIYRAQMPARRCVTQRFRFARGERRQPGSRSNIYYRYLALMTIVVSALSVGPWRNGRR